MSTPYSSAPRPDLVWCFWNLPGRLRMPRDAIWSTSLFLSRESTPASSMELPPFVSTGSRDPNLGILKWDLGWILSRMFLATGWKTSSDVVKVKLAWSSLWNRPCVSSLMPCTEQWPKAWGWGGGGALNTTAAEMLRNHGEKKLMLETILLHSSHSTP